MIKAWMIIFLFLPNPVDPSQEEEENFIGKIEIPYASMDECNAARLTLVTEGEDNQYAFICVTDEHRSGKAYDKNIPIS